MIAPTIGRRVWYVPSLQDRGLGERQGPESTMAVDGTLPCDAGIVYVHGDRCVNLAVHDHRGQHHARHSVLLLQEGDVRPETGGFAEWMPYQVASAKKEEPAS